VRLTAQLVQTESGLQLWSETLEAPADGEPAPIELVGRLVDTIDVQIKNAELKRLGSTASADPYSLTLRANAQLPYVGDSPEARQRIRAMLDEALRIDPDYVPALAALTTVLANESDHLRGADAAAGRAALLKQADEVSLRAVAAGPNSADAWTARSQLLQYRGDTPAATEAIERALRLNPYSNDAHGQHGLALAYAGRFEDALAAFDRAIRLNPGSSNVGAHLYHRCRTLLFLRRYTDAIQACERATAFTAEWVDYMVLTAAYAMAGDRANAERNKRLLLERRPGLRIADLDNAAAQANERVARAREETLIAGLRRAGLPE
jgi:tetratricopeptide (TPR) repeat protein